MRGNLPPRLVVFEIVPELGARLRLALDQPRHQHAVLGQVLAQAAQEVGVLAEAFHQNLPGAVQGRLDVGHALVGVEEFPGLGLGLEIRVGQQGIGQRLEARLAGDLRLGPALGFVRQIEVFQPLLGLGLHQLGLQLGGELALLLDTGEHRRTPRFQLAQIIQALGQMAQLGVVQAAGGLLAVAGDEGHGGALVEQGDGGLDLDGGGAEFLGDAGFDGGQHKDQMARR